MKIYKFAISPYETPLSLPLGAQILSADRQEEDIVIWVLGNFDVPNVKCEPRNIVTFGTGQEIEETGLKFIDTVRYNHLVFHLFEKQV